MSLSRPFFFFFEIVGTNQKQPLFPSPTNLVETTTVIPLRFRPSVFSSAILFAISFSSAISSICDFVFVCDFACLFEAKHQGAAKVGDGELRER
jgi:hypothetical protein